MKDVEPLLHFAVPFAAVSVLGVRLRWALLAGFVGLLPDFDVLLFMHRSVSHSTLPAFILLLLSIPALRLVKLKMHLRFSAFGWGSHTLLDFIQGYTPILWPLYDKAVRLVFESRLLMKSSPSVRFTLKIAEEPYHFGVFEFFDAPLFTAEGLAITLILIAFSLSRQWRGRRLHTPPHAED